MSSFRCGNDEIKIHFVQDVTSSSQCMRQAYQACQKAKLSTQIVHPDELDCIQLNSKTVLVLDDFTTDLFHTLVKSEALIVGPLCLSHCVSKDVPVPENQSPVFNLSMIGVIVTTTGLTREQKEMTKRLVGYMGGSYTDSYTGAVTHLIAVDRLTPKFEVAVQKSIPIVTLDWVEAVWSSRDDPNSTAGDFVPRHAFPLFKGLKITCSNLPQAGKKSIADTVTQNGGEYLTSLIQHSTTTLVIGDPAEGSKFQHAQLWRIPVVKPEWVFRCVDLKRILPYDDFLVKSRPMCSTPNSTLPNFSVDSDLSTIPFGSDDTRVNDSAASSVSIVKSKPVFPPYQQSLADLSDSVSSPDFLDGCRVFLSGYTGSDLDKLRRILNKGGATLMLKLDDRVSHVVVGKFVSEDVRQISNMLSRPPVVTIDWVVASIRLNSPAPVDQFLALTGHQERDKAPPASPLSSRALSLLKSQKTKTPSKRLFDESQKNVAQEKMPPKSEFVAPRQVESRNESLDETSCGPLFRGLKFAVIGFDEPDLLVDAITKAEGVIVSLSNSPDYTVVPLPNPVVTDSQVVTAFWIEDCYDQGKLVPIEYFHRPLSLACESEPLSGSYICVTGFTGKERSFVVHVANLLGAVVQDSFAKKDHPAKGVYRSTHLVCKSPTGAKHAAAVRWGVPTVSAHWLIATAESKQPVSETKYLLTESNPHSTSFIPVTPHGPAKSVTEVPVTPAVPQVAPTTSQVSVTPVASQSRIPVPLLLEKSQNSKTRKLPELDAMETESPVSLKRRMSVASPGPSPFHVATPDTPYGQVFLKDDEVPSANTKKKWKEYIDNFPNLHDSPEIQEFRKQRNSTPLSVIMKQIWVKFGGIQVEGIEPGTGNILPDGPFGEYAEQNSTVNCGEQTVGSANTEREGPASPPPPPFPSSALLAFNDMWPNKDEIQNRIEEKALAPRWDFGPENRRIFSRNLNEELAQAEEVKIQSEVEEVKSIAETEKKIENAKTNETHKIDFNFETHRKDESERRRIFVISNIPSSDRKKYEEIVKNLGGEVSTASCFDPNSTHLVVEKLLRSEKLLCSIASGKWVLHLSYLNQCYQSRMFLPEQDYEFGNERSDSRLPKLTPGSMEAQLARAAHYWRFRKTVAGGGHVPFRGFKAVIFAGNDSKFGQYKRLLEAGGGSVLPQEEILSATHVFWDEGRTRLPVPEEQLKSHSIQCLKPVFLSDYLIKPRA